MNYYPFQKKLDLEKYDQQYDKLKEQAQTNDIAKDLYDYYSNKNNVKEPILEPAPAPVRSRDELHQEKTKYGMASRFYKSFENRKKDPQRSKTFESYRDEYKQQYENKIGAYYNSNLNEKPINKIYQNFSGPADDEAAN